MQGRLVAEKALAVGDDHQRLLGVSRGQHDRGGQTSDFWMPAGKEKPMYPAAFGCPLSSSIRSAVTASSPKSRTKCTVVLTL